ncbi:MgtC/SapB family protein [Clostridium sp. D2Q-11]|uniref:MgtC/SapB family protein n=1 Tax=Anaeromonas frigoriresistens TaxID=2683708 RepID=A0A942Z8F7_9FIRM|nr:MgtC/SapB family protein [Anaeromonas frigoriresistens]MBS4537875.1 MgtC/SapB family protein [Anaeromonas frigoriresistens]
MIGYGEVALRLVLSAILGAFIGMEREVNNRPAGLRTHVLVTLGSALIMLISMYGFEGMGESGTGGEPARLAAQVVSGIGFLGAGTIMRTDTSIKGLTTAASLWVCGGIGLAIGNGYYIGGLITSAIVLFTLMSLGHVEQKLLKRKYKVLYINCIERAGLVGEIGVLLGQHSITIKDIRIISDDEEDESENISMKMKFMIKVPGTVLSSKLLNQLRNIHGVVSAELELDNSTI